MNLDAIRDRYGVDVWQRYGADLADHVMYHDRLMRAQTTLVPLAQKKTDLELASCFCATGTVASRSICCS